MNSISGYLQAFAGLFALLSAYYWRRSCREKVSCTRPSNWNDDETYNCYVSGAIIAKDSNSNKECYYHVVPTMISQGKLNAKAAAWAAAAACSQGVSLIFSLDCGFC